MTARVTPRVLAYGGRAFRARRRVRIELDELRRRCDDFIVISGAAGKFERDRVTVKEGADLFAWEWAVDNRMFWILHPADWDWLCKGCDAPFKRCGPALWEQQRKCCPDCSHEPEQASRNSAGPIRNRIMRDRWRPHRGLEFAGGKGTRGMRQLLEEAGIPTGSLCRRCWRIQSTEHTCEEAT